MALELFSREAGEGPVLLLMHGLFGSSRNWVGVQKHLAEHYRVVSLDLRNHGSSPWADRMDYDEMALDVAGFIDALGSQPVALLGHSMGGKVAMTVALRYPTLVSRLIVADIAPVAYQPHFSDYIRAMQALDLASVGRRADADHALAASIETPGVRAFLLQNLVQVNGRWSWRINLPVLARALPALGAFPVGEQAVQWTGRTRFIRGANSNYVLDGHRDSINRYFPGAELVTIDQAGHWLHAEQPARFVSSVIEFLESES